MHFLAGGRRTTLIEAARPAQGAARDGAASQRSGAPDARPPGLALGM
jgi:hypothetical protein